MARLRHLHVGPLLRTRRQLLRGVEDDDRRQDGGSGDGDGDGDEKEQ